MQTSKPHMFGFMSPEKNMIILKTYALYEYNKQSAIIMNSELLVFNMISLNADMQHACNVMILFKID